MEELNTRGWHFCLVITRALTSFKWIYPLFWTEPGVISCMSFHGLPEVGPGITQWKECGQHGHSVFLEDKVSFGGMDSFHRLSQSMEPARFLYWCYVPGSRGSENQQCLALLHTGGHFQRQDECEWRPWTAVDQSCFGRLSVRAAGRVTEWIFHIWPMMRKICWHFAMFWSGMCCLPGLEMFKFAVFPLDRVVWGEGRGNEKRGRLHSQGSNSEMPCISHLWVGHELAQLMTDGNH